jgi:hypothetical protein
LSTTTLSDAGLVVAGAEPVEVDLLGDLPSELVWVAPVVLALGVELEPELAPLPPPEVSTIATITTTATTRPPMISVVARAGERRSER